MARLQKAAVESLNDLIERLARHRGASPREIGAVAVRANTTMVHLLLGLDPFNICLVPHVPVVKGPGVVPAGDLGLAVNLRAPVYFLPAVAGCLGGRRGGGSAGERPAPAGGAFPFCGHRYQRRDRAGQPGVAAGVCGGRRADPGGRGGGLRHACRARGHRPRED
ncbi:hypothetical protein [Desulfovirgula thermocuniculi]|uniref:hypothetical protein n=1 Tax=Desulfovirgula thermocuniculi TaxID=348842 RepID=UPI0024816D4C|nr:hypothetical protein [Desulfovirgula thermocuniculi]